MGLLILGICLIVVTLAAIVICLIRTRTLHNLKSWYGKMFFGIGLAAIVGGILLIVNYFVHFIG